MYSMVTGGGEPLRHLRATDTFRSGGNDDLDSGVPLNTKSQLLPGAGRVLAAALLVGLAAIPARGQEPDAPAPTLSADTLDDTGVSAAGAFARSLVLPGWGQAYVGSPGRGAVYFALEAGAAWMTFKSYRQLDEAREVQAWERESGRLGENEKLSVVSSREEQFEDWLTLSIFVLLFSGVDAFVTAQLADFDEHVGVRPGTEGGMRLEATLPVGRRR